MDIEGEDNQVVGEDALGDEDDDSVKSSQDIDTTIMFIKPLPSYGDAVFGKWTTVNKIRVWFLPFWSHWS